MTPPNPTRPAGPPRGAHMTWLDPQRAPGPSDLADAARVCRAAANDLTCPIRPGRAEWLADRLDEFADVISDALRPAAAPRREE